MLDVERDDLCGFGVCDGADGQKSFRVQIIECGGPVSQRLVEVLRKQDNQKVTTEVNPLECVSHLTSIDQHYYLSGSGTQRRFQHYCLPTTPHHCLLPTTTGAVPKMWLLG